MTESGRNQTELRLLRTYALVATATLGVLALAAFRRDGGDAKFDTITVERINVVEKDGTVRLVISNKGRSPGQVLHGKKFLPDGQRQAGMVFYNNAGDENGGLIFGGWRENGRVNAGASLTFDQFEQDQVVALQYTDEQGRRSQGLTVLDRPDAPLDSVIAREEVLKRMPNGPAKDSAIQRFVDYQGGVSYGAPRLFVGRDASKSAVVRLADRFGRPRLRLVVDSAGAAGVEFLNDSGRVTHRLP
jgi:hypothetical protein